jgi:hypothetical protein
MRACGANGHECTQIAPISCFHASGHTFSSGFFFFLFRAVSRPPDALFFSFGYVRSASANNAAIRTKKRKEAK